MQYIKRRFRIEGYDSDSLRHILYRAILVTFLLIATALLVNAKDNYNAYYIKPIENCIFLSFIGLLLPKSNNKYLRLIELIFVIGLSTYFTYLEFEMWQGNNLATPFDGEKIGRIRVRINWLIIGGCYLTGIVLSKRSWMGMVAVSTAFTILGFFSYVVVEFRGETLLPSDMGALRTALNVAESYQLKIKSNVFAALFCYIVIMIWALRLRSKSQSWDKRVYNSVRLGAGLIIMLSVWLFYIYPVEKYFYPWFVPNNGYVYSVMLNLKMLNVKPDKSYSLEEIDERLSSVKGKSMIGEFDPKTSIQKSFPKSTKTNPNIICIMNESFADFSVLGDFQTDTEMFPNMKKLREESIYGNLDVEVFGGGTADSEYSFLTSNSTLLFADNARAYQLYVRDDVSSLPKRLKTQGYKTYGVHPDKAENWNRNNVYPKLGLEDFKTLDTFENPELIRNLFTSDRETYKKIEKLYESKKDKPLFVFDVTIQNHGSYNVGYENLQPVHLVQPQGNFPQTEQYLSLVHESDRALGELVDYFKKVDEPTVILMFGDHLPKVENEFYTSILGKNLDQLTLEEQRERYTTPFMIWANYDIPEQEIDVMSVNYLSTLLNEVTGTRKTQYDKYLEELYQKYPIIDRKGVMTKDGAHVAYSNLSDEAASDVSLYKNIVYNNVLGKENKRSMYFD